jgi:hypothetical protein
METEFARSAAALVFPSGRFLLIGVPEAGTFLEILTGKKILLVWLMDKFGGLSLATTESEICSINLELDHWNRATGARAGNNKWRRGE